MLLTLTKQNTKSKCDCGVVMASSSFVTHQYDQLAFRDNVLGVSHLYGGMAFRHKLKDNFLETTLFEKKEDGRGIYHLFKNGMTLKLLKILKVNSLYCQCYNS